MSTQARCPCGAKLNTRPELDGHRVACPVCGKRLVVCYGGTRVVLENELSDSGELRPEPAPRRQRPTGPASTTKPKSFRYKKQTSGISVSAKRNMVIGLLVLSALACVSVIGFTAWSLFGPGDETQVAQNEEGESGAETEGEIEAGENTTSGGGGLTGIDFGKGIREDRQPLNENGNQNSRSGVSNTVVNPVKSDRSNRVNNFNNGGDRLSKNNNGSSQNDSAGGNTASSSSNSVGQGNTGSSNGGASNNGVSSGSQNTPPNDGMMRRDTTGSSGSNGSNRPSGFNNRPNDGSSNTGGSNNNTTGANGANRSTRPIGDGANIRPQNPFLTRPPNSANRPSGMRPPGMSGIRPPTMSGARPPTMSGARPPRFSNGGGGTRSLSNSSGNSSNNNNATTSAPESEGVLVDVDEDTSDVVASDGQAFGESSETRVEKIFSTGEGTIRDIAVTQDNEYLAVVTRTGNLFVFDRQDDSLMYRTDGSRIRRVEFSQDPKYLYTVSDPGEDAAIAIRAISSGGVLTKLVGDKGKKAPNALAVSRNGRSAYAAWSSKDGSYFWRLDALREFSDRFEMRELYGDEDRIPMAAAFTSNERAVLLAFSDGKLMGATSDGRKFIKINELEVHVGRITALASLNESNFAVTGGQDGQVVLTDVQNWSAKRVGNGGSDVLALAVSPNDEFIAVTRADMTVEVYKVNGLRRIDSIKTNSLGTAVEFIDDGKRLVVGSQNGDVRVISLEKK